MMELNRLIINKGACKDKNKMAVHTADFTKCLETAVTGRWAH
jgi:hypothetical protein